MSMVCEKTGIRRHPSELKTSTNALVHILSHARGSEYGEFASEQIHSGILLKSIQTNSDRASEPASQRACCSAVPSKLS